jgi:hypothetical protein
LRREKAGPAEWTSHQKGKEMQDNKSQNMKPGNGADTRELSRTVQMGK